MDQSPSFEEIIDLQSQADEALRTFWLDVVFIYSWWMLAGLAVFPWLVWWMLADRHRMFEILTYGFLVMFVSFLFDAIGVEADLWEYKYQPVPCWTYL